MKNLNIIKVANIITIFVMAFMLVMPFLAHGAFTIPDATGTGLPNEAKTSDIVMRVIQILLAVAGLVAVIFLIVGGFRYILAGGNEEAAESAKKTITNAIIGIVIIILAFVIVRVISNALISTGSTGV
ncbi:hypothetical protein D4R52_03680 [bacterium]|nr:MAG: hypothetical protein D4R52_03680 [bacterium]